MATTARIATVERASIVVRRIRFLPLGSFE
jgi:hypothetical protein